MKKNNSHYKINTSLEFKTEKQTKGRRKLTFALFFSIGVIMLACVCLLLLLREYDFNVDNIIGRKPETTQTENPSGIVETVEGSANFLVLCSDNKNRKIHHCAIVHVDLAEKEMKIYTVDTRKKNGKQSLAELFESSDGSMLKFKEALEDLTDVKIDRYIRANDTSFKGLVKIFGGVAYDVKRRVEYSYDGVGYIIDEGYQTLTPDMSYKYMYYLSQQNANEPETMSMFLSAMLTNFLTGENFNSADKYYNKLRNILDTDISAFDFSGNQSALGQFISGYEGKSAVLVDSTSDF